MTREEIHTYIRISGRTHFHLFDVDEVIDKIYDDFENRNCYRCKLWQPKEGEWIVIYPTHPTMNKPTSFTVRQYFSNDPYWKLHIEKCEPFIGELPSFIKDKK